MAESFRSRLMRVFFNFFPAYRGTGARMTDISEDWREVRIRLPLSWRTRNYVGTIYGGSLYAAVDPFLRGQVFTRQFGTPTISHVKT